MESYASNEPRIGIVKTAMGACAFAVFTAECGERRDMK